MSHHAHHPREFLSAALTRVDSNPELELCLWHVSYREGQDGKEQVKEREGGRKGVRGREGGREGEVRKGG